MPSKEECKRALKHLIECKQRKLCDKCNFKIRCTMPNDELVIENLIDEHFKLVEKVYKLETQKERLINEYTEEHQLADEHKFNEFILEKALDKACNMLYEYNDILSQEKWKEWCIEDGK